MILGITRRGDDLSPLQMDREFRIRNDTHAEFRRDLNLNLKAASSNTWKTIGTVPITLSVNTQPHDPLDQYERGLPANELRVLADDARNQAIVATTDQLIVVPLQDFSLPDEPFLQVRTHGAEDLIIGRRATIRVEMLDKQVGLDWEDLPEGMQPVKGGLEWTPRQDQVGLFQFAAVLKHGTQERRQVISVNVAFPNVVLPFWPNHFELDAGEKYAVCWYSPLTRLNYEEAPPSETPLAVIDLSTLKVIAHGKLPFAVAAAALTPEMLLVADRESNVVQVLNLSTLKRTTILHGEDVVEQIHVWNNESAIFSGNGAVAAVSLPDLKRVDSYRVNDFDRQRTFGECVSANGLAGPILRGILLDTAVKKTRLLIDPYEFVGFQAEDNREGASRNHGDMTILPDFPAMVKFDLVSSPGESQGDLFLVAMDLVKYEKKRFRLAKLPPKEMYELARTSDEHLGPHLPDSIRVAGKTAVFIAGQRLHRWTADHLKPTDYPLPVRIKAEQSPRTHRQGEDESLTLCTRWGTAVSICLA